MHPPPASFARRSRPRSRSLAACAGALALLLGVAAAHAVEVEGLYDAEVEVRGQGGAERERGFEAALRKVIVRVSGNSEAPQNPDLEDVLGAPERYVQSFRYRSISDDELEALDHEGDDDPPTDYLAVRFNGSRLVRDLREQEIAIWGERRPEVLLWIAVDDGRERYIVGEDDGADARAALEDRAGMRGLPLLLPLLDVEDRERIDFIDIRAPFIDAVEHASERYRADIILLGHVTRRGDGDDDWTADWTLLGADREVQWRLRGGDRDAMLNAGIDGATDRIAAREAGREGGSVELVVEVAAIDSVAGYTRVADYLGSLARVSSADLQRVHGDRAAFRVELQGRPEELQRAIAAGSLLDPAVAPEMADELAPVTDTDALDELVDELIGAAPGDDADTDAGDDDERPAEPIRLFYRLAG